MGNSDLQWDVEGMSMVVRVFKYIIKAIIISIILLISAILTVRVVNTFKLNRVQKLLSDLYYEDRLYFEGFIDEKSIGDLEIKQSSFKRTKESLLTLKSIDKDNGNTYFIFDENGKTWCGIVYASNIPQIPRWIHIKPIEEMWYVYWTE